MPQALPPLVKQNSNGNVMPSFNNSKTVTATMPSVKPNGWNSHSNKGGTTWNDKKPTNMAKHNRYSAAPPIQPVKGRGSILGK